MKLIDLFKAIESGKLEEVKKVIASGINYSATHEGKTAIDVACELGNEDIITYLLTLPTFEVKSTEEAPAADDEICIVGYSSIFPNSGTTPEQFWQTLCKDNNAISEVPTERWSSEHFYDADKKVPGKMYTKRGGFIDHSPYGFDEGFFNIVPKEAEMMDPQQRIMLEGIWYAMEHAGINPAALKGKSVGVFCGIMTHDYADMLIQSKIDPNNFIGTGNGASVLSGRVSYIFGFQGPSMTIDTACSSSLVTTHQACNSLRLGDCDVAFSAGVNLMLGPGVTMNCCKANMLSPDGACKTFSAQADGYGRGEGCGVVVLKRRKDAIRDNNHIYGVIKGSAVNQDGQSSALTVPNKQAQVQVIQKALSQAELTPDDIDYIEAHGTGTLTGDPIEISALKEVFANRNASLDRVQVSSVKAYIGHTEAAAGVAGVIKVLLALQHQSLPALPIAGSVNPKIKVEDSRLGLLQTPTPWKANVARKRRAGVSSFGFSGTNGHLIIEEPDQKPLPTKMRLALQWENEKDLVKPLQDSEDQPQQLLTLSAKSPKALKQVMKNTLALLATLSHDEVDTWLDLVYSLQAHRQHFSENRITVVADSITDCMRKLSAVTDDALAASKPSKRQFAWFITELTDMDLTSYRFRYKTDALFQSLVETALKNVPEEYILEVKKVFTQNSTVVIANELAKFISCYALYQRYQRLGIGTNTLLSLGMGHFIAAVLDARLSLSDAIQLWIAKQQKNAAFFNQIAKQIIIRDSNGLWPAKTENFVSNLFNDSIAFESMPQCELWSLASARQEMFLSILEAAYLTGAEISWASYWQGSMRTSRQLPQYPFSREIHRAHQTIALNHSDAPTQHKNAMPAKSYELAWQAFEINQCADLNADTFLMLFKVTAQQYKDVLWRQTIEASLKKLNIKPYWLHHGVQNTQNNLFTLNFNDQDQWHNLAQTLKKLSVIRIVDLSYLDLAAQLVDLDNSPAALAKPLIESHYCFLALKDAKIKCDYLAYFFKAGELDAHFDMRMASIQGQYRTISFSQTSPVTLQISTEKDAIIPALESTLLKKIEVSTLLFEQQSWRQRALSEVTLNAKPQFVVPDSECVIITGGLGALGLTLTKIFAENRVKNIVLLARSAATADQAAQVAAIEKATQCKINILKVDVTEKHHLSDALQGLVKVTPIHSVFHLAGKATISRFEKISVSDYVDSLNGKVVGALNLKAALQKLPHWPKNVVLFSSSSSIFPELGQTTYAAANNMLDALANTSKKDQPIQSINWGLWGAAGFGADAEMLKRVRSGTTPLTQEECEHFLFSALQDKHAQIAVLNLAWGEYVKHLTVAEKALVTGLLPTNVAKPALASGNNARAEIQALAANKQRDAIIHLVRNIIHEITGLKYDQLDLNLQFEAELAIDSNLISAIRERLQDELGESNAPFVATLLFDYGNIADLAAFLQENLTNTKKEAQPSELPTDYIRKLVNSTTVDVIIKTLQNSKQAKEPPLVLIHTIMGSVYFYRALINFLEYQGNIYGIDDPYFSSLNKKFDSLTEMATAYAKAIKAKFSGQTIRLAGLSFAGAVAYEVAQQLLMMGEKVDNVVMFDSAKPGAGNLSLPQNNREYVMGEVSAEIDTYYQAEINNNQRILNAHLPEAPKDNLRVILLKARSRDSVNQALPSLNSECNGWLDLFCPEVYSVPGSHFSLFDRAYVATTTNAMRFAYARSGYFIDRHLQPDVKFNREQLLAQAAKNGDSYLVLRLLKQNVSPFYQDDSKLTAAAYAVMNDDLCSLAWIHHYTGKKLNIIELMPLAQRSSALKTMSYLVENMNNPEVPEPDIFLASDTNKMQQQIFSADTREYKEREWMGILAAHNSTKSAANTSQGPMQILASSVTSVAAEPSFDLQNSTKIQCGTFSYDIVCRLRKGQPNKPNLFLMHAASGLALPYSNLDDLHFGNVYGISNPYFGQEKAGFSEVKAMASDYIRRIKAIQPTGPYHLGGWSLGGIVATEMASQLEQQGEQVAWVVMIDSVNHFTKPYYPEAEKTAIDAILDKNDSIKRLPLMREAITRCYMQTSEMLRKHRASGFGGKVILLKADEHEANHSVDDSSLVKWRKDILKDPFSGWSDILPNLEIHSVTGGHNELFEKEFIGGVHHSLKSICLHYPGDITIADLSIRWCMNLVKALRRRDTRMVDLLMQAPDTNYRYQDAVGNLLDILQANDLSDLFAKLNLDGLSQLRTASGSNAAEVALEFGLFDLFNRLNEKTVSLPSVVQTGFFQSGSQARFATQSTPAAQP